MTSVLLTKVMFAYDSKAHQPEQELITPNGLAPGLSL